MSAQGVRAWIEAHAPDLEIITLEASTATVAEAAAALGVEPGEIAKSLAIRVGERVFLLVTRGDARLSNAKCKAELGGRPRMLGPEETLAVTGHPVGGVCPFDLPDGLPVYLDLSLKGFATIYPAGGSLNTSVRATPGRLAELFGGHWVDLSTLPGDPR